MSESNFISVIIPTRHREAILFKTLENGLQAIEGKNAELIVVNDGDTDIDIPARFKGNISLYNNPSKGVSSARNFGASVARGNILFIIDDDMWINKEAIDWIFHFISSEKNSGKAVYNLNWQYPSSLNAELQKSKIGKFLISANYHCMWGRMKQSGNQPQSGLYQCNAIASCSLLMEKNLFNAIGKYNEKFIFQGEDIELSNRLNVLQVPIYAVFDVLLFHNHQDRLEINGFLQRIKKGYQSEFEAKAKGLLPANDNEFNGNKRKLYELVRMTEPFWMFVYKALPNVNMLNKINRRLIGLLAGLEKFKQWKFNTASGNR